MSRSLLPTAALVLSAALAMTAAHAAGADAGGHGASPAQMLAMTGPLKLQKTYFENANANGAALASGFNSYGSSQTVNCGVTAGCFIIVNANVQVAGTANVNPSAISIKVDGTSINAPFNTPVSTTSFTVMSYQTGIAVAFGNHTVSTDVYVTSATTMYRYNTEIKLYK